LSRIHSAYTNAAGIELTVSARGSTHSVFGRFIIRLRRGVVVGEQFVSSGPTPIELVARAGGSTYQRRVGRACWHPLASSDPRTLQDVGLPFPFGRLPGKAKQSERHGKDWILRTENKENFWFLATQTRYKPTVKRFVTYTIDAKSGRVTSMFIQALKNGTMNIRAQKHPPAEWWTASLQVKTLAAAPRLRTPTPTC
jgi:hypothetical protein